MPQRLFAQLAVEDLAQVPTVLQQHYTTFEDQGCRQMMFTVKHMDDGQTVIESRGQ